ncbi:ubiquitin-associated/translation elongation factor ef1b [Anaeramoeba flamelloides]|uniref:Ubiquitin-associated/translation elongation factor ef1b n=1 Tax=Anaeramoeba flamelloides TaxID=1746091 RepID=A0ABQ8YTK2_9EUKA|nr:ubiquitin-associated/translation elongation factor ef1b [Anaeramoeba flamelloides]
MSDTKWTAKYVSSLFNESSSQGWSIEETQVLRECIRRYGYSCWETIMKKNLIPGKTHSQLYHHSMRLCGQQSLYLYKGIHLDVNHLYLENRNKTGKNIKRKAGMIIKEKEMLTKEQKGEKITDLVKQYELSSKSIKDTKILRLKNSGNYKQIFKRRLMLLKMLQKVQKLRKQKEKELEQETKTETETETTKEERTETKKQEIPENQEEDIKMDIIENEPEEKKENNKEITKVKEIKFEKIQLKQEKSEKDQVVEPEVKKRRIKKEKQNKIGLKEETNPTIKKEINTTIKKEENPVLKEEEKKVLKEEENNMDIIKKEDNSAKTKKDQKKN